MRIIEQTGGGLFGLYDRELYNSLPPVVPADREFSQRPDTGRFFELAGQLICEFDLETYVGVCLLHKHNFVDTDEIMVESLEILEEGKPALVMALTKDGESSDFIPVNWKLGQSASERVFYPLEHSNIEAAKTGHAQLVAQPEFLSRFRSLLIEFGYEDVIGLTLLRVQSLDRKADEHLVERSHPNRIANVVTVEAQPPDAATAFIKTNWSFRKNMIDAAGRCEVSCEVVTVCRPDDDKHIEEKGHDKFHISGQKV